MPFSSPLTHFHQSAQNCTIILRKKKKKEKNISKTSQEKLSERATPDPFNALTLNDQMTSNEIYVKCKLLLITVNVTLVTRGYGVVLRSKRITHIERFPILLFKSIKPSQGDKEKIIKQSVETT